MTDPSAPRPGPDALPFASPCPLVGMVHLLPLPGAPGYGGSMATVVRRATEEARILAGEGMDGILIENYGDTPFHPGPNPPETIAAMAVVVSGLRALLEEEGHTLPVGVNVLRNDARGALGLCAATGASFLRVNVHTGVMTTDQGILEGRAHETLRVRQSLWPGQPVGGGDAPGTARARSPAILADVFVKHAVPPTRLSLEGAARDAWERGGCDALILTGNGTGRPVDPERIGRVRRVLPAARIWVGSGVDAGSAPTLLPEVDGAIVGSTLHREGIAGRGIDPGRVRTFLQAARGR